MQRDFCATVFILDRDRVLLIHHRKFDKWLPPGGHIDEGEIPHEAAIREAKEETGIDIEIIPQENLHVHYSNAISLPRPYLILLEEVPAFGDKPFHQHIDMIYLGRPVGGTVNHNTAETHGASWWTLEELATLTPGVHIFQETLDIIAHLFKTRLECLGV